LNPADDYSQWNVIQSLSYKISTYEYPLPTTVYAQHVAIMENEDPLNPEYQQSLLLTEVEVYGLSERNISTKKQNININFTRMEKVFIQTNAKCDFLFLSYKFVY